MLTVMDNKQDFSLWKLSSKDDLGNELQTCKRNVRGMHQYTHYTHSPNQVWSEGPLHLTMRHHCLTVNKRALSVHF